MQSVRESRHNRSCANILFQCLDDFADLTSLVNVTIIHDTHAPNKIDYFERVWQTRSRLFSPIRERKTSHTHSQKHSAVASFKTPSHAASSNHPRWNHVWLTDYTPHHCFRLDDSNRIQVTSSCPVASHHCKFKAQNEASFPGDSTLWIQLNLSRKEHESVVTSPHFTASQHKAPTIVKTRRHLRIFLVPLQVRINVTHPHGRL